MAAPDRPLLLPHVFARRHVVSGSPLVVLHDTDRLENHRVSERAWIVAGAMDGTRDAVGIQRECEKQGAATTIEEVRAFIAELAGAGLVGEAHSARDDAAVSDQTHDADPPTRSARVEAPRPLEHLPGFVLQCDGGGSCCRFYPTVAFSPLDAARARAHLPLVQNAGMHPELGFTAMRGTDARMLAVALVDGRCAYLTKDDRCSIHERAGGDAKPLGCRTYPARFVDDGQSVRVSPWLECACVLASATAKEGSALVDPSVRSTSDLDPAIFVERLADSIHVAPGRCASPAEISAWATTVCGSRISNACASLLGLAAVLEARGLDETDCRRALEDPPPPDEARLRHFLETLAPRAQRLAEESWRSDDDLARRSAIALSAAVTLALASLPELMGPTARFAEEEAFYVRALIFGHQLCHVRRPMSLVATDRAVRVVLARAIAVVAALTDLDDPAFAHPLGLVESSMRAYGLVAYLADVGVDAQPA